jgi:phospholipid/cholesterol/gamma-HCH transport system substrate-binding protein
VPTQNSLPEPARRGYVLLAGLLVAAIVIFNMDAIRDLGRRDIHIVALLEDAPGVRVGTPVWVEGVRVGRVQGVRIIKENDAPLVELQLRMEPRSRALITRSSDIRASRQRFIGEPVVRVFAGSPQQPPIEDGDTIRGQARLTPAELMAEAAAVPIMLDSIRDAAVVVQARLEERRPDMERLSNQLQATTAAASALRDQLDGGSLGRMLDGATGLRPRIRALRTRLAELSGALDHVTARYGPDLEGGGGLAAHLDGLAVRSRNVQAALAALEARIEDGDGFVGRMQQDTALQVAVRGVQLQIDSLMAEAYSVAFRMFLP